MHVAERIAFLRGQGAVLGEVFDRTAAIRGARPVVEEDETGLTLDHHEAVDRVARLAGALVEGIEPGDRIVVATPNGYDQLLLSVAVSRAGAVAVPVNDAMTAGEVEHVVADADAARVVRSVDDLDLSAAGIDQVGAPEPEDTAALFYTSGTTGAPKGAELTHAALVGALTAGIALPSGLRRDEALVSLPVAHIMGFAGLLGMAVAGIPVHFHPRFHPTRVLEAIEARRCTMFLGVPAMYRMLLETGAEDRDLTSVRIWASGADVMPADLARRFKRFGATATLPLLGPLGEAAFVEGYGMVELGGGVATKFSPPFLSLGLGDSLGVPLPRYSFRVVDEEGERVGPGQEGELQVKGPGVLKGYWGAPEATDAVMTPDGWLRTGDLARRGPMGTALFSGREKDVIVSGGYNVYPPEIEAALEAHPDVLEAAAVGLVDEVRGEIPVAVVRLIDGSEVDGEALCTWSEDQLAAYKVPHRVLVVDEELPKTATRKVRRSQVLAHFAD